MDSFPWYASSHAGGGAALMVVANTPSASMGRGSLDVSASAQLCTRVVSGLKPCLMRHTRDPQLAVCAAGLLASLSASPSCPPV